MSGCADKVKLNEKFALIRQDIGSVDSPVSTWEFIYKN